MSQTPKDGNVIFLNFGAKRRVDSAEETGGPAVEATAPPAYSPAAMRVFNAAVRQTDVARAKRGHEYATQGRVLDLTPVPMGMRADVAGSQNEPFHVNLHLPRRSTPDIEQALHSLLGTAGSVEAMRKGDIEDDVLDVLVCSEPGEIRFTCDCPDGARVCKHAVALAERAAALIDADPTIVLTMRGVTLSSLEDRKRRAAQDLARENAEPGSRYFWAGRKLPELPRPKVAPMIEDSDIDLLHSAMQTVSFTNIDQLRAVSDIEDLYDALTRR